MTPGSQAHARAGIGVALRGRRWLLGFVVVAVLGVSGCAADAAVDVEPSESPSTPVSEPSPTATAPEPAADVLFTITAEVRATDGTAITIRMVGHEPHVWSSPDVSDLADQFLERCSSGTGVTPIDASYLDANGATLMLVDFESDSPDYQFASPIQLYFGNQFFPRAAFTDAVVTGGGETDCYAGATWVFSNDAYAISAFEAGSPSPDRRQWQFGSFGFQLLPDSGTSIESCVKVITELGLASGVESVSGWDVSRSDGPTACGIGYIEEHDHDH